jgi:hypothetical protein
MRNMKSTNRPIIPVCPHCNREVRPPREGKPYNMIAYRNTPDDSIGYYHDTCFESAERKRMMDEEQSGLIEDLLSWLPKNVVKSLTDKEITGRNRVPEEKKWVLIKQNEYCDEYYSMESFDSKKKIHSAMVDLVGDDGEFVIGVYRNRQPVYFRSQVIVEIDENIPFQKIEE